MEEQGVNEEEETEWVSHCFEEKQVPKTSYSLPDFTKDEEDRREEEKGVEILLPDDLLERIISSLPVASVLQASSVCKKWHEIVASGRFLWNRSSSHTPWYFMFTSCEDPVGYAYDPVLHKWHAIDLPFIDKLNCSVAASSGLVSFMDADNRREVCVCNPIIKLYRALKDPHGAIPADYTTLAISVDRDTHTYTLSLVTSKQVAGNFVLCYVVIRSYHSGTGLWATHTSEILDGWRGGDDSVICGGVLYLMVHSTTVWLPGTRHGLLSYDLYGPKRGGQLMDGFLAAPCTLTCGRLMNLQGKVVLVGGIGRMDRPGVIKGIGVWALEGREWEEIGRMPQRFFHGFGELDDVFSSGGMGNLVYVQSYGSPLLSVFDISLNQWRWSQRCPVTKKFSLQLFTGFCFDPRLEVLP